MYVGEKGKTAYHPEHDAETKKPLLFPEASGLGRTRTYVITYIISGVAT
jgi:hypothetical protein